MPCTGRFSTAQEFADFWCREPMCDEDKIKIEFYLDIAAADIHVAMAATGMCDCTLADWATVFLKKLNILDAELLQHCLARCGRTAQMNTEMRGLWLNWMNTQLEAIRMGKLELCAGHTSGDFPSMGWAQQGHTDFQKAQIIWNDILRNT